MLLLTRDRAIVEGLKLMIFGLQEVACAVNSIHSVSFSWR